MEILWNNELIFTKPSYMFLLQVSFMVIGQKV